MLSLMTPIRQLPGIGPELSKKFEALGIVAVADALVHFPFRHEDWRQRMAITDLVEGENVTILATISSIKTRRAWRRKLNITEATVTDDSGRLKVVWFNQPYLATWFTPGQAVFLSGQVTTAKGRQMLNPIYERPSDNPLHTKLVPVYPSTAGLSQWHIRRLLRHAVSVASLIADPLPTDIQSTYQLMPRAEAIAYIHFPEDPTILAAAVRRLKFDELLAWQMAWLINHDSQQVPPAPIVTFREAEVRQFVQGLPFALTAGQRIAAWQVIQDMNKNQPMSRLVQGDVGSGKTVVAAIAAYNAARQGWQVVLIAPTIVLAEQHWQTFRQTLAREDLTVALVTGPKTESTNPAFHSRATVTAAIAAGTIQIVIATQAIFDEDIRWQALGLVVVDEQQRFGVAQRQALLEGHHLARKPTPHFLSLTATPIPRTLALHLAGELAISVIKEKPPGRAPIVSKVFGPTEREKVDRHLRQTVEAGHQAYIITPLITESDVLGVRAATTEYERLADTFPRARVGLLHGSMPAKERIQVMHHFRQHHLDLLVSTTVIEVGVDVPNATAMVIEGAERFGLAQLHQLRGRVGRGAQASTCLFVTDDPAPSVRQRLEQVACTDSGFDLAEADLALRGGGDLYGLRQSGLPEWRLATLRDHEIFAATRAAAKTFLAVHGDLLKHAVWQDLLHQAGVTSHRE